MTTVVHDFDEWHEIVKVFFDATQLDFSQPFRAESNFVQHGDLVLAKVRFTPQYFAHNPGVLKEVDNDYLLFEYYIDGVGKGLADDTASLVRPGHFHLVDMSRSFFTASTNSIVESAVVPHAAVGYDPSRDPAYVSVPAGSAKANMLRMAQTALMAAVENDEPEAEALNAAFCSLIRTLMLNRRGSLTPEQAETGVQAMIRQYIEQHLSDPELSVQRICGVFGVSRSSLYRLFENQGGIAGHITARRLDRCLAELVSTPAERGQVRRVAERWGFFEPANFNRSFRDRFGVRPSDCIGTGMVSASLVPDLTENPLHRWMRKT